MKVQSAKILFDREIEAVSKVLSCGRLREGPLCKQFEEEFRKKADASYAVSVCNGTFALSMVYEYAFKPGDEVLVPSFTFFATVGPLVRLGVRPVFCDIDPGTFTLDPDDARKRITSKTKGIVAVHLFGQPAEICRIQAIARDHGLFVVWDAAHAHFARFEGRDVGSFPEAVCYSFYATKNMTCGEGGMILTTDHNLAEHVTLLKRQGQKSKYVHSVMGMNMRMTDIQAAIGLVQLEKVWEYNRRRRQIAEIYRQKLGDIPYIVLPERAADREHVYHQYLVLLCSKQTDILRDEVVGKMRNRGIEVTVNYPHPVHKQPVFERTYGRQSLRISELVARDSFCLPIHPFLSQSDIDLVCQSLRKALDIKE